MPPLPPESPHPFSRIGLELIWEGKYDAEGQRCEPDPAALARPLSPLASYGTDTEGNESQEWRNRLFQGDNLALLASLLPELRGKITLIYIDPPYDADADFTSRFPLGSEPAALERLAYRDRWGRGSASYLQMMYERLRLMHELLADSGTLYLHIDYRMQAYLRAMLAEIFGEECFMNEIIWSYKTGGTPEAFGFARKHDTLLVFRKGKRPVFNETLQKSYARTLPEPHTPSGSRLGVQRDDTCDLCENGAPGQKYRQVRCRDVWDDLNSIYRNDTQATGYATQKPEALLERIIRASSSEGDLVADFFCGSGTTGAVAERLGRRWIMSDLGTLAVQTSLKRLLAQQPRGFDLYRLETATTCADSQPECKAERLSSSAVRLVSYAPSWQDIAPKERARLESLAGEDRLAFVDFWAVGPAALPGEAFRPLWHAYRTKKSQALESLSPPLDSSSCEQAHGPLCLQIIDLFGEETFLTLP